MACSARSLARWDIAHRRALDFFDGQHIAEFVLALAQPIVFTIIFAPCLALAV